MPTISVFRIVLIAALMFDIFTVVASVNLSGTLPPILQEYLAQSEAEALSAGDITLMVVAIAALVVLVVSIIGLWKFKRWARSLYVLVTLVLIIAIPLIGPVVMNTWEYLFDAIGYVLSGVALAMMFSGETGKMFQSTKVKSGR